MPDSINCGVWNIHGHNSRVLGNKLDLPEVQSIINDHDIFGITETHSGENSNLDLPNHKCYIKSRPKSRTKLHGGLAIYIRKSLKTAITYVPNNNANTIWCKLDKTYLVRERASERGADCFDTINKHGGSRGHER